MAVNSSQENMQAHRKTGRTRKVLGILAFILMQAAVVASTAFSEFRGGGSGNEPQLDRHTWFFLLGGILCLAAALGAETVKYLVMMRALGEKRSLRAAFETAALGKYYDNVTPFGAGGQPFQIWWLHRRGYSAGAAGAMPVAGFLSMQWGFIALALVTFLTWRSVDLGAVRYTAYVGILFYMAVPCLLMVFSLAPRLAEKVLSFFIRLGARIRLIRDPEKALSGAVDTLTQYRDSLALLAGKKSQLLALFSLSILYQTALCSLPYFVLMSFGSQVSYWEILASTIYIYAAITVIPTPGNSIAAEGSFYLVFSAAGASGVFWAMLIWRFLSYYSFIVIGILVHAADAFVRKKK